jgi:hypothetical protein
MPNLKPAVDPVFAILLSGFAALVSVVAVDEVEDPLHPNIKHKTTSDKKMEAIRFICYFLMKK